MAHNTRVRADLGAWSAAVPVEPSEFYALDSAAFEAVNGDKGGIWNPTSVIKVGGAGLVLNGVHYIDINSELRATYSGAKITLANGGKLQVDAGGTVDLGASGTILSSGGSLSGIYYGSRQFYGSSVFAGTTDLTGSGGTISAPFACAGSGRIRKRIIDGVDSGHTYTAADADIVIVPALTNTHVYLLGAGTSGDEMEFRCIEAIAGWHILFQSSYGIYGATNWNLQLRNYQAGDTFAARFVYRSGWHVMQISVVPAP